MGHWRPARRAGLGGLILLALGAAGPAADESPPAPEVGRLRAHVETLASPEFLGRRGVGAQKAADYLVGEFRKLGLKPLFGGSYSQTIPGKEGGPASGRNVGARLDGRDPKRADEWVIVSAHYDHLGARGEAVYPGADDNASGVAMMLELARSLAGAPGPPSRGVMFVGFDLEEVGLFGSRYFAEHPPVPLDHVALFVTADMIGRSLGGVCDRHVFVMGTEHAPGLRPWLADAAKGAPLALGTLGSDLLLLDRSDYGPFRARKVPYLFFSTGENPLYHTTNDRPETIDYGKLGAISRLIFDVVRKAADADEVPKWAPAGEPSLDEASTLRDVIGILLDHRDDLKIGPAQALVMKNTLKSLDAILARGSITPAERTGVVRVVRILLLSLFGT